MIEVIAPLGNSAEILFSATNLPNTFPTPLVRRITSRWLSVSLMLGPLNQRPPNSGREEQYADHEDGTDHELPVLGPYRHQVFQQQEYASANHRPEEGAHAAEQRDHHDDTRRIVMQD